MLAATFGLSDLGVEEALFEAGFYLAFVGISGTQRTPVRLGIMGFRHLLEVHDMSARIPQIINTALVAGALLLVVGTKVNVTLVAAPSSTKRVAVSVTQRSTRSRRPTSGTLE